MVVAVHTGVWDGLGTKNTILGVTDYFCVPFKTKKFRQNTRLDVLIPTNFISNSNSL